MRSSASWKVMTIRGVDLRLHFTLFFLLIYVVFVSAIQFPLVVSQAGLRVEDLALGSVASGLIFALGLLISVALHEFGHVLVAQAQGLPVHGVTLMMLGGVSEIGATSKHPYGEFKLAVVGPLISLGIGILLWMVHSAVSQPELALFCYWLGSANIILAIFNILPAFPLDGGRALRSFLAVKYGNLKGTRIAVRVSEVLAWTMGIYGLFTFNLFLMLIALFVYSAAQSEMLVLITQGVLRGLKVKDAMVAMKPIDGDLSLKDAAEEMLRSRNRMLLVQNRKNELGLINLDMIRKVDKRLWDGIPLQEGMIVASKSLQPNDLVGDSLPDLVASPLSALPVKEGGEGVGVLRYLDLSEIIQFRLLENPSADEDQDIAA